MKVARARPRGSLLTTGSANMKNEGQSVGAYRGLRPYRAIPVEFLTEERLSKAIATTEQHIADSDRGIALQGDMLGQAECSGMRRARISSRLSQSSENQSAQLTLRSAMLAEYYSRLGGGLRA